ncbi:MAG: MscL family protein [Defluviitaleaceae bacterium]|nr:MscL family protein [Defluviitaleaceae bacterium]
MAFVVFLIVKAMNRLTEAMKKPAEAAPPTTQSCPFCTTEISLKATRCPACTSQLDYK